MIQDNTVGLTETAIGSAEFYQGSGAIWLKIYIILICIATTDIEIQCSSILIH